MTLMKFDEIDRSKEKTDICVTTEAVYDICIDNWIKSIETRRIPVEYIDKISVSLTSYEFILHSHYDDYDQRLLSPKR